MTRYLTRNRASLYLGDLNCLGATTDSSGNVFTIEAQAAEVSWGAAAPIEVAVQRWMTDGAVAITKGYENRELTFQVKIAAATSVALAAGETALALAARATRTVTWLPPEGSSAPSTVFDVWTCYLTAEFDSDEENRLTRTYTVTATAQPWARSTVPVTVPANPTAGAGTTVSIDTGASVTGWTGTPNAPTTTGTLIRETQTSFPSLFAAGQTTLSLTRTGSVTGMGTTPYLAVTFNRSGSAAGAFVSKTVTVDGVACTLVGSSLSGSDIVNYFQVPAGVTSFTTFKMTVVLKVVQVSGSVNFDLADLTRTSVIGATSTHKMLNRQLEVGGSATTCGSIQIASPSATVLGNVLCYTGPNDGSGYVPALRQWRNAGISGTTTVDATMVSGSKDAMNGAGANHFYDVPAGVLREGTYVVVVRIVATTLISLPVQFKTFIPGTTTVSGGGADVVSTTVTTAGAATVWAVVGAITIPGVAVPAESTLATRVGMSYPSGTGTATADEVFLLDVTRGAYSLVTTAGSGFTKLWLDCPDVTGNNTPQIYSGSASDRSDAARLPYAQIVSLGDHDLAPEGAQVFTVTDGVDDAVVTASFYQRSHTNAAA